MSRQANRSRGCPFAGPFASSSGAHNPRTRGASWAVAPMTLYVPSFFSFFSTFTPSTVPIGLSRGGRS